jgi:hypothetical protein
MKVTAFYYLDYPDDDIPDPLNAETMMYVEVGEEEDDINHFAYTYSFQVYTAKYVRDNFFDEGIPLIGRSIMIVPKLDSDWMREFLNENIENLPHWSDKK